MSKNTSTAATETSQYMHFSLCHPSAWERVPLKERHCAFYEQTQLKKDSSQTNDISNSAYSNAAAHKNMLTKHKPRSNSHNEITLWNTIQRHSKTFYHTSPPTTQVYQNSKRSLSKTGLWSPTTWTLHEIFQMLPLSLTARKNHSKTFWSVLRSLLNLNNLANSIF